MPFWLQSGGICKILTHLAFRANAEKRGISNDYVTVLKARGKRTLADMICSCKMTLVMALHSVTLFLRLKDIANTCKYMQQSPTIGGDFFSPMALSWKKLKTSNSLFIVC